MSLTAKLLLLCLLSMSMLMGILVLVVARGERSSQALRLWGWGLISYACGMLVIISSVFLPVDVTQVVGNGLISLSAVLTSRGVFMHTPVRQNPAVAWGGLVLVLATLLMNHTFLRLGLALDIAVPTLYATLLYIAVSWHLIRRPPPAARAAAIFLVTTVILTLVVWNVRLGLILLSFDHTPDPERVYLLQAWFAVFQMLLVVCSTLGLMWVEVRLMEDDLRRSAFTDLLTGLPNRRSMTLRFEEEIARCKRLKQKFGLVLFDIDHFKQINDNYGHYVGDGVLRHIAATLDQAKRGEDVLGRIGGEEFLVILPHHERAASLAAAERLRAAVEAARPAEGGSMPGTTVSGGVVLYPDDGEDWDRLYVAADRRMYRAKRTGRNRVEDADA